MSTKTFPLKCRIQAAAKAVNGSTVTRVDIYDDIGGGDGWFGAPGVTAQDFIAQLGDIKGELEVHINSAGGDVFEGIAISNAINGYSGYVTTIVDGLAASIASIIAQSGRNRIMQAGSMMMIHDAFGGCVGNEAEMMAMAKTLAKISDNLADIYAKRSKKGTKATWREQMREEKWFTAEEAVVSGLADGIGEQQAELPAGLDVAAFSGVPERIAARLLTLPKPKMHKNKALAVHHTGTVDTPWDGGKAKKGFPNDSKVLIYCNAWFDSADDSEGAEDKKGNYKFPHHMTNGGPANLAACRNGLARLPGSNIPDNEKTGVEAHLRAHLKDADAADAENSLDWFVNRYGRHGRLSIVNELPKIDADYGKWNAAKVFRNGADSRDPEAFFRATCAGRRSGDPTRPESWCLPYKASPSSKPNAHGVREAIASIAHTPGIVNAEQAREFLIDLAKQIDPKFTEDEFDSQLLAAALLQGLKGA